MIALRERFNIEEHNAAIASRIIKDTLITELIKEDDPESKTKKICEVYSFLGIVYLITILHELHINAYCTDNQSDTYLTLI